jgi:hypothetical protein
VERVVQADALHAVGQLVVVVTPVYGMSCRLGLCLYAVCAPRGGLPRTLLVAFFRLFYLLFRLFYTIIVVSGAGHVPDHPAAAACLTYRGLEGVGLHHVWYRVGRHGSS